MPSVSNSWPSLVFIMFKYTSNITVTYNQSILAEYISNCSGTLIDRFTVLTAASCIVSQLNLSANGTSYPYTGNQTLRSFYTVYAGEYDLYNLNTVSYRVQARKLSSTLIVKINTFNQRCHKI